MIDKKQVSEMRKLTEIARSRGKILPVSEAFRLFPVEEEAHKGKQEYWTQGEKDA
jgi:hypothetical protein